MVLGTTHIVQVQHHLQLWNAHMAVPFLHMNILVSGSSTQRPVQMPGQYQVLLLYSKVIQQYIQAVLST